MRKAFFAGVELWEALQEFPDAFAERQGDAEHEGVRQTYKKANPQSINAVRPLEVRCVVEERAEGSAAGYETGTALTNTLHDVERLLLAQATELQDLCYCENDARTAAVSGSETAGANVEVAIGAVGGGWVPATNDLVLFLNRTTGAGFATVVEGVGSGTVTCDLAQDLTSAWRVIRVERVFRSVMYRGMSRSPVRGPDDPERDVPEVAYRFSGYGAVVFPAASVLAHGAS